MPLKFWQFPIMFPDFLIIRHGETVWNRSGRMQGALDSPLTARGIQQAQIYRSIIHSLNTSGWDVFSSPQHRALHTASIVFSKTSHEIHARQGLREIDIGNWAGRRTDDVITDISAIHDIKNCDLGYYNYSPVENLSRLRDRCERFMSSLKRPCVIVTHGITSRMLRLFALGLPNSAIASLPGGQGVVYGVIGNVHKAYGALGVSSDDI